MRHQVPVALLEFDEGGNTLWVHGPNGATVLRVKCTGKIKVQKECSNIVSHVDLQVVGDMNICVVEGDDGS